METLRDIEPFGYLHIPVLSDSELTATYETTSWAKLSRTWKITMYLTFPETQEPVEMPAVTLPLGPMTVTEPSKVEEEPEDAILIASGILPRLVARARQEPPSPDWERELDEL